MTYEEAREYTKTISKTGSVMGLKSIRCLMKELGDVQEELSVIHIAGTNGKGSVSAFLAAALMETGYRVGRYTSPAVFSPLEVWTVNQTDISAEDYASVLSRVKSACDKMTAKQLPHPTIFEVETAAAFLYFYEKQCNYVLLETGMGGSTDATNVIEKPICSVITSIGMDHMQFLGNSQKQIAEAKAGIIKRCCPLVTTVQKHEVMEVLRHTAAKFHAPIWTADISAAACVKKGRSGISYDLPDFGRVSIKLTGEYQIENSLLALTVLKEVLNIPREAILTGLQKAEWKGRFEILWEKPVFIIDGAHNEPAAIALKKTLQNYFTNRNITYIIGVLADKEHEKMLKELLPFAKRVYTVTPQNLRALDGKILATEAAKYGQPAEYCPTVEAAVKAALLVSGAEDVILAFGSLSYLGEVKIALEKLRETE